MDVLELRDRVSAIPALEKKRAVLDKDIQDTESGLSELLRRYGKESRDLERIKAESLSAFLLRMIGKYEDKLEKEQREEIAAKLACDRARARLDSLLRERDELAARISSLRAEEKTYHRELADRRAKISGRLTAVADERYVALEQRRNLLLSQITEIKEALSAAARARSTALAALDSLESAEGWATFDAFTRGGIFSHMAKYSHIDSAEECFHLLSSQLQSLKSELADVHGIAAPGLQEISSTQRAVDFWFDNIFTDLSVRGQIRDNAGSIRTLLGNLAVAESALQSKLNGHSAELAENKRQEEELLLSL